MRKTVITVASGKGGTGKTTIALALTQALARRKDPVTLLDADAEAPNVHLFLKPDFDYQEIVTRPVPEVDEAVCNGCGLCREVCASKAIIILAEKPLIFPELCSGCGACALLCPEKAIREIDHEVGWIEGGRVNEIDFFQGRLKVGEAKVTPVIGALREHQGEDGFTVIDAPPGTTCPVIEASKKADYLVLVTEPTPFGLCDLELAVEMSRALKLVHGVIVNRSDMGGRDVFDYCRSQQIPILMEIPFDRRFAESYARGGMLLDVHPEWTSFMQSFADSVQEGVMT